VKDEDYVKGIIFGIISLILVSLQPIVAVSRPGVLDAYIFAAMTCIVETIIFLPLMVIERKQIRSKFEKNLLESEKCEILLYGWKRHKKLLRYIGINFAIAQILGGSFQTSI
jgi:hypothetical protein